MKEVSFDKEKLVRAYRSLSEQLNLLSSMLSKCEYSPHVNSVKNYKLLLESTNSSLERAYQELTKFEFRQKKLQAESDIDLSDIDIQFNDNQSTTMISNSNYVLNSSLDYISKGNTQNKDFHPLYEAICCDFSNLTEHFVQSNPELSSNSIMLELCNILCSWFTHRYDIKKYNVNLVSCYTRWIDCILIYFSGLCMNSNSVSSALDEIRAEGKVLVEWSSNGGTGRYIDKRSSFSAEKGGGVPSYIAQYTLMNKGYKMYPSQAQKLGITIAQIEFAVLLEDLIKPALFYASIQNQSDEQLAEDKYLHSLRNNAKIALHIEILSTSTLKNRWDFLLGE